MRDLRPDARLEIAGGCGGGRRLVGCRAVLPAVGLHHQVVRQPRQMSCPGDLADVAQLKCAAVLFDPPRCLSWFASGAGDGSRPLLRAPGRLRRAPRRPTLRASLVAVARLSTPSFLATSGPRPGSSGGRSSNARLLKSEQRSIAIGQPTGRLGGVRRSRPDRPPQRCGRAGLPPPRAPPPSPA